MARPLFDPPWHMWHLWRCVRWSILGGVTAGTLWACTATSLVKPEPEVSQVTNQTFAQAVNRKLDLIFMVDNSFSMQPLQSKLATNLPVLVQALTALKGGLPDIHIAVVSSSVQPGQLSDIEGCMPADVDNGRFRHAFNPTGIPNHPECDGLTLTGNFIKAEAGAAPNFTGNIATVFGCMALLGEGGCGFEAQLESVQLALDPKNPIPDNVGFLRDDAYLGVVMLTNEDDCSAPPNTQLFTDEQSSSSGPWGRLMSYRCTEFGILCDGVKPPHTMAPLTTATLNGCVSAEGQGDLTKIADFESFLVGLKGGDKSKILMASISGPPTPFSVSTYQSRSSNTPDPNDPMAPGLVPSCVATNGTDYSDPGVRLAQVVTDLGGVFSSICADDYSPAMAKIGAALVAKIGPQCLSANVLDTPTGVPDCTATDRSYSATGVETDTVVPFCTTAVAPFASPCWRLVDSTECTMGKLFDVCRDPTCGASGTTANSSDDTIVQCATQP